MNGDRLAPTLDLTFPHHWRAEILAARPLILPPHHFVYPLQTEEVERGALEVLVRPGAPSDSIEGHDPNPASCQGTTSVVPKEPQKSLRGLQPAEKLNPEGIHEGFVSGHDFCRAASTIKSTWALAPAGNPPINVPSSQPFLATCALGFRDPQVPTGLWSCPNPNEICAVSGGYAYIVDTTDPARFTMIPYRPVLDVRPVPAQGLLLFVGHHAVLAWGADEQAWQSEKLSDEGVTIAAIEGNQLHGLGWRMMTDKETPFTLDLRTGLRI